MAKTNEKKKTKRQEKAAGGVDRQRFPKIIKSRNQIPRGEHRGMKLLLTEDVPFVGKQGEVVEVKPGHGRNYLIPQGLATYVTPEALVRIEKHRQNVEALRVAKLADLKMLAKELEKHSVTIEANATEDGHLYGSVTAIDISKSLASANFKVEQDQIRLEGPLKELGLYHVNVHLAEEVDVEIKVWVVPTAQKSDAT